MGLGAQSAEGRKGVGVWRDSRNSWSTERQRQNWGLESGAPKSKRIGAWSAVNPDPFLMM